jgi:hypothetical protein
LQAVQRARLGRLGHPGRNVAATDAVDRCRGQFAKKLAACQPAAGRIEAQFKAVFGEKGAIAANNVRE